MIGLALRARDGTCSEIDGVFAMAIGPAFVAGEGGRGWCVAGVERREGEKDVCSGSEDNTEIIDQVECGS